MSDYIGCIILESLADESVIDLFTVEASNDRRAPDGEKFPIWRERLIRVSDAQGEASAEHLASAMREGFYAHFFNDAWLFVVFKGRAFKLPKEMDASWDEMIEYGRTLDVDPHYTRNIPLKREQLFGG